MKKLQTNLAPSQLFGPGVDRTSLLSSAVFFITRRASRLDVYNLRFSGLSLLGPRLIRVVLHNYLIEILIYATNKALIRLGAGTGSESLSRP